MYSQPHSSTASHMRIQVRDPMCGQFLEGRFLPVATSFQFHLHARKTQMMQQYLHLCGTYFFGSNSVQHLVSHKCNLYMYQNSACPSTLVGYAANVNKGHREYFKVNGKSQQTRSLKCSWYKEEMRARKLDCRQNLLVMTTLFLDVAIFPNESLQI